MESEIEESDVDSVENDDDGIENDEQATGVSDKFVSDGKYRNRQRVLVISSRGVNARHRHLLDDVRRLIPHHKRDNKIDSKDNLRVINEIADIMGCNWTVYLESRKHTDLYMWLSKMPNGPSVKFNVQNVHTMEELRMTGNCMLGSRPLLDFDANFDSSQPWKLIKQLLINIFGTPRGHPKSKPFVDRVMGFFVVDGKIWVRNYQILPTHGEKTSANKGSLVEIGPRFVLTPIKVFSDSFQGSCLYQNNEYVSPGIARSEERRSRQARKGHGDVVEKKKNKRAKREENTLEPNLIDLAFTEA